MIWWCNVIALVTASAVDIRSRRIPNWLVIPFLGGGLMCHGVTSGWSGVALSFSGVGLAALLFGLPCITRGMGMGDLKLAAGVGAWIGPGQLFLAFVLTGITGALMAVSYAMYHRSLGKCLDGAGALVVHIGKAGLRPHPKMSIDNPAGLSIPYAPAIAIGTLLSFAAR